MSLDKKDEKDAFYIKCLLALGAVAGTFGFLFQGPTQPPAPPNTLPPNTTWRRNTKYSVGDLITFNDVVWKCITDHTSSTEFTFDTKYWRHPSFEIPPPSPPNTPVPEPTPPPNTPPLPPGTNWRRNTKYNVGDLIKYKGVVWKCIIAHTSTTEFTFDTKYWRHPSFEPKPTPPTVPPPTPPTSIPVWKPNTRYSVGDLMTYNGVVWKCIIAHTSTTEFTFDTQNWRHPSFVAPLKPSDFSVSLVDPEPYHAGAVLFKRCYKNILGPLNQIMLTRCIEEIPSKETVTPTRDIRLFLGNYSDNCFVSTNGIYFDLEYLEDLYTKHSVNNNVDSIKQNFLNELLKAYIEFIKLPSGRKVVSVRTTLVPNETRISIGERTRELVDNRDIYGFAARTMPFKYEHQDLDDANYVGSTAYKNYKALMAPLGVSEAEYYLITAKEISNLLNPGEIKTALQESVRNVTIRIKPLSGAIALVRSFSSGDKKEMEWNQDYLTRLDPNRLSDRQGFINVLFHETAHTVDDAFTRTKQSSPSYVSEGFANWCEGKIKGLSWAKWPKPKPADWRGKYDTFAAFLEFVERNFPGFVVKFHHLKINAGYEEESIKTITGKTGDQWWAEYLRNTEQKI